MFLNCEFKHVYLNIYSIQGINNADEKDPTDAILQSYFTI